MAASCKSKFKRVSLFNIPNTVIPCQPVLYHRVKLTLHRIGQTCESSKLILSFLKKRNVTTYEFLFSLLQFSIKSPDLNISLIQLHNCSTNWNLSIHTSNPTTSFRIKKIPISQFDTNCTAFFNFQHILSDPINSNMKPF